MAIFSNVPVPAADVALLNADVVVFQPQNKIAQAVRIASTRTRWNRAGDFTDGAGDESATGFPATRAHDQLTSKLTKPDAARDPWFWMFDAPSGLIFDTFVLIGHNLGGLNVTVRLQIADDETFTTNLETIATFSGLTGSTSGRNDDRLVSFNLDHTSTAPQTYSDVLFFRIEFDFSLALIPEIREVFLGERQQLKRGILAPHDPQHAMSETRLVRSRSGSAVVFEFNRGQGEFDPEVIAASLDPTEATRIRDIFTRNRQGALPLIYTPRPGTVPLDSYFGFLDPPELLFPIDGAGNRRALLNIREQGPFFRELERVGNEL